MILRAVIYARCSTEEESQKDALRKQVDEGRSCVRENGWILADIYVESRSGTTTKGRSEYNRLYEDLSSGRFDIIVIKSQDRLMRNTKDWYLFVDRLLTEQKKLYIYIERKFYTTDDALITGIKAILAEEYSRELSKKINNAHRNRQKQNGPVVLTSNTYGYRKMPDKSVVIIEEEAQIKRRMYELCAAGFGSRTISA
ncbi:MAG: recombinase family protein, partial [Lachnospiraceae bacterium]|nr:recombinase family protein [Lachnospiraceae bacterium]